ncbi:MAG: ABC transporter substrate-binding protein [Campylobacterota bacterium]|nr:ABC transporter substrate-binding protein [Campylobacterota bacterium]
MKRLVLFMLVVFIFTACEENQENEIQIGFVAGLNGKYSSLGTSIRDGFMLAFDEIDYKIDDKTIKIIQKDDKQDKKEAKKIIDSFIKNNIKIVVGNATSSMTDITFPIVNKQKDMLLFSVTASSQDFTGQDDNFIRLQVEVSKKRYQILLDYLDKKGFKNIFFIYDSKNKSHMKGYEIILQEEFIANGGNGFVNKFDTNDNYDDLLKKMQSSNYDLILIVANSIDSANVIQYLKVNNINKPIIASGWAKTMDFITNGGKAVEGVFFSTAYNDDSNNEKFLKFREKFQKKYKKLPSVFAAQGYETAQVLIKNLKKSKDISVLKKNILTKRKYDGLQGDIIFDKYGDVSREYFMMKVKNGKYVKVK